MRCAATVCAGALAVVGVPVRAQDEPVQPAIHAGLALCRAWVDGIKAKVVTQPTFDADAFAQAAAGSVTVKRVQSLPDGLLPLATLRFMSDYWHLDAGSAGGVFVASSRFMRRCEVVGGGSVDFQPAAIAEIASPAFAADWLTIDRKTDLSIDMTTVRYKRAGNKREELLVSRAVAPGGRSDRVQFLATLTYEIRN